MLAPVPKLAPSFRAEECLNKALTGTRTPGFPSVSHRFAALPTCYRVRWGVIAGARAGAPDVWGATYRPLMEITKDRVQSLIGPLRAIAMDQPAVQEATRQRLRDLTADVDASGHPEWIKILAAANSAEDGHADEPLQALISDLP